MGHCQMQKTGQLSSAFGITPRIHQELNVRNELVSVFWNDACLLITTPVDMVSSNNKQARTTHLLLFANCMDLIILFFNTTDLIILIC